MYGRTSSESCSENTPAISESYSENSPKNPETPKPGVLPGFFVGIRGKCCPFFSGVSPGDCPPSFFGFFRVLPVLGFLFGGFFGTNFGLGVRSLWGGFLGLKCPFLRPENGKDKVLPFLGFFRSSIFVTARFCGGFLGSELRELYWMCFCWFRVCVFVWIYLSDSGSFFSCRSRDSGAAVSGSVFLLLFSSSFVFPLSFSGLAWVLFPCFLAFVARTTVLVEAGQAEHLLAVCLLFLFSLPGSAPLFLALFSLSSPSLSFFLACSNLT